MATTPNRMTPIEHYRQYGLEPPIRFRARLRFHLLMWLGFPLLFIGGIAAIAQGEFTMQLVGIFALCFFSWCFVVMLGAMVRSWTRGLCELSTSGLYLAHIGYTVPWNDIGPAWILTSTAMGRTTNCVHFVVKNASGHASQMGLIGRLLFAISRWMSRSRSGDLLDRGLQAFSNVAADAADTDMSADEIRGEFSAALEQTRRAVSDDPDSAVFNIPLPLHYGISPTDLSDIINQHVLHTQTLRQTPPAPPVPVLHESVPATTASGRTPQLQSGFASMTTSPSKDAIKRHYEQIMKSGADAIRARQRLGELTPEAAEAEYQALRQRVTSDYRRAKTELTHAASTERALGDVTEPVLHLGDGSAMPRATSQSDATAPSNPPRGSTLRYAVLLIAVAGLGALIAAVMVNRDYLLATYRAATHPAYKLTSTTTLRDLCKQSPYTLKGPIRNMRTVLDNPFRDMKLVPKGRPTASQIREILSRGAPVNEHGGEPLRLAAVNLDSECIEALISAGADVHARDGRGNTALHLAVRDAATQERSLLDRRDLALPPEELQRVHNNIRALVQAGADIDAIGSWGASVQERQTPLIAAVYEDAAATVALLLELGADVNVVVPYESGGSADTTALIRSVMTNRRDQSKITVMLLSRGADANFRNDFGTALDYELSYAWTPGRQPAREALKRATSRPAPADRSSPGPDPVAERPPLGRDRSLPGRRPRSNRPRRSTRAAPQGSPPAGGPHREPPTPPGHDSLCEAALAVMSTLQQLASASPARPDR